MKTVSLITTGVLATLVAVGQSTQKTKNDGELILDNDKVKIYQYDGSPGKDVCGLGKHSHPAHLTVLLTDANVTVTTPDGKVKSDKMKAGTSFWSEAETHTVINSGTNPIKCQIIELKGQKK